MYNGTHQQFISSLVLYVMFGTQQTDLAALRPYILIVRHGTMEPLLAPLKSRRSRHLARYFDTPKLPYGDYGQAFLSLDFFLLR